jgi:hypothetical protein
VLARRESHQDKKSSMLRKLRISEARLSVDEPDASPATAETESPGAPDQA